MFQKGHGEQERKTDTQRAAVCHRTPVERIAVNTRPSQRKLEWAWWERGIPLSLQSQRLPEAAQGDRTSYNQAICPKVA